MEWISVKDRLPELGQRIVAYRNIESQQCYCTIWDEEELKYYDWNEVTHWMPLPELPKN